MALTVGDNKGDRSQLNSIAPHSHRFSHRIEANLLEGRLDQSPTFGRLG